MTHVINLDGEHLTLEDVIAVARHGATCEIDQEAKKAVEASRKIVDDIVREKAGSLRCYNRIRLSLQCQHLTRRYDSTARKPNPYALFRLW